MNFFENRLEEKAVMSSTIRVMARIGTLVLGVAAVVVALAVGPRIEGVWGAQDSAEISATANTD